MQEYEFDKTRKSIKSDELDSGARRDMLSKFQDAGGQVMRERSVHQDEPESGGSGGGRRAGGGGGADVRLPSEIAREKNRMQAEKDAAMRRKAEQEEKDASSFLARFMLKIKCMMAGVTPYGRDMVTTRFLSTLNLDAKRAIMECQILGNDLFMNNAKVAQKIVKELDKKNPLLVELIQRASELYNRNELNELVGSYSPSNQTAQPLGVLRSPVFSLARKLYYIKPYAETYLIACDMAIDIQQKEEGKQAALYAAKKKKIRQEWRLLMGNIYSGLVLLVQRSEMKNTEPGSALYEKILEILEAERLGQRKAGDSIGAVEEEEKKKEEPKNEESEEAEEETEEKKKEQQLSKELVYGYRLMKIHPVEALRKKHDGGGSFKNIPVGNRTLLSLLFFREFEEEYSFILTTPQIDLNPSYEGGAKLDYREKMRDLFETIRIPNDRFREYFDEAEEYYRLQSESTSSMNYVEHQKRIQLVEGRLGGKAREARIQAKDYIDKTIAILKALIIDMRGSNQIVGNRDAVIKFQMERDSRKRLNGKAIKDCIMQAYCYCVAFAYRLGEDDLFSTQDMTEEELAEAFDTTAL